MKIDLACNWRPMTGLALTAVVCAAVFVPGVSEGRLSDVLLLLGAMVGARTADKILAKPGATG